MYGWVDLDSKGYVRKVSFKVQISNNIIEEHAVLGAFTFKKAEYFFKYDQRIIKKNRRVNNEFYLDVLVDECVGGLLKVVPFEVSKYFCHGTPSDLKAYLPKMH